MPPLLRFTTSLLLGALLSHPIVATEYHISPYGDDQHPGTADRPWQTPQHALDQLRAGDTLVFADGVYATTQPLVLRVGEPSEPDAWTTVRAAPGAQPVISATGQSWPGQNEFGEQGWLRIEQSRHVRVIGLIVQQSPGGGISAHAGCSHIEILGCRIDGSDDFGIGLWNLAHARVLGNEVNRANLRQHGGRRSAQEGISLGHVTDFEVAWNHVHHGRKEGIDIKRPSQRGRVHHNVVHDMSRQGLYLDSRRVGTMREIEVDHNIAYHNEWGLALSGEQATAVMEDIHVHHNLLYANRGSGLIVAPWVEDGPRRRLRIEHNTLVGNGTRLTSWAGSLGNLDLRSANVTDSVVRANLCADGGTFDLAVPFPPDEAAAALEERRILIAGNRVAIVDSIGETVAGEFPRPYPCFGDKATDAVPFFVNAAAGDFRLTPATPASLTDLGAFPPGEPDWAATVRTHAGAWPVPHSAR